MLRFVILVITLAVPILGASLEGRVIGGEDADLGDVPSIVSSQSDDRSHFCGGVLISKDYVLTAGHCAIRASSAAYVQYGVVELTPGIEDEKSTIRIAKRLVHENYNNTYGLQNDIALLKLAKSVTFGKYVQPAVLPDQDEPAPGGSNGLLAGWGYTGIGETFPTRLQKVNLTIVDIKECQNIHVDKVFDHNLCAGVPGGWKGHCAGDSGGPIVYNGKVVGLVSWSMQPCASPPYPGVYTRVASFRDWIRKNSGV